MKMQVDLTDDNGTNFKYNHDTFTIASEDKRYRLHYTETGLVLANGLRDSQGRNFSTVDKDSSYAGCTTKFKGAWWYYHNDDGSNTGRCHNSNLNGEYFDDGSNEPRYGMVWGASESSMVKTMMKLQEI